MEQFSLRFKDADLAQQLAAYMLTAADITVSCTDITVSCKNRVQESQLRFKTAFNSARAEMAEA